MNKQINAKLQYALDGLPLAKEQKQALTDVFEECMKETSSGVGRDIAYLYITPEGDIRGINGVIYDSAQDFANDLIKYFNNGYIFRIKVEGVIYTDIHCTIIEEIRRIILSIASLNGSDLTSEYFVKQAQVIDY